MKIDLIAPAGCGIRHDKRLRKLVLIAENVKDQEDLYEIANRITVYREQADPRKEG